MTVRELLDRMGSDELSEWLAWDEIEGVLDQHYGLAQIASLIANTHGGNTTPADYYPVRPETPPQSIDEQKAALYAVFAAHNARLKGS